jgi:hypothetical protein
VYNSGNVTASYAVRLRIGTFYDSGATVIGHVPGTYRYVAFPTWTATQAGGQTVVAFTNLTGDVDRANDTAYGGCTVLPAPPGWSVRASYPAGSRNIKEGAWLAHDAGTGRIYAPRGYKTSDFCGYNPATDSWRSLSSWPPGTEVKPPSKGAAGCASGSGAVYATKGNNTQGFWRYEASTNAWTQRANVPLGYTNKKVKGGTDIVWAYSAGVGHAYLLKGYRNEFWRYDVAGDSWHALAKAPGLIPKWDKGSWLAYDGARTIYAHKAKFHEFYKYDTELDSWFPAALVAMPTPGSAGSKKSKDGGCGTYLNSAVYALKGGNTQEFWRYSVAGNAWAELETMPRGSSRKKVKAGADIVAVEASDMLYALKGNKTLEFYRYSPAVSGDGSGPGTEADAVRADCIWALRVAPNPVRGRVSVEYYLSRSGPVELKLHDVTGALVTTLRRSRLAAGRHTATFDAAGLGRGVYLLRLDWAGGSMVRKLVVE